MQYDAVCDENGCLWYCGISQFFCVLFFLPIIPLSLITKHLRPSLFLRRTVWYLVSFLFFWIIKTPGKFNVLLDHKIWGGNSGYIFVENDPLNMKGLWSLINEVLFISFTKSCCFFLFFFFFKLISLWLGTRMI